MNPSNQIELTEFESEDFIRHIDRKIMWRDQTNKIYENLSNGAVVDPIYTFSSSHFWIKRNFLPLDETDYIYISGCNLIITDESNITQQIIKLKNDCIYTSIFIQTSASGEKMIMIGQKVRPAIHEADNPTHKPVYYGRVEMINYSRLEERHCLDHSYFVNYNHFVYDAVVPANTDKCLTIIKNIDTSESDTKVFLWDYATIEVLTVEDFDHHIEQIVTNENNKHVYILYALFYCAIWEYFPSKKRMYPQHIYVNDMREVTDAAFIKSDIFEGIAISYRSLRIEIFNKDHSLLKVINLNEVYVSISNMKGASGSSYSEHNNNNNNGNQEESISVHNQSESYDILKDSPLLQNLEINNVYINLMLTSKNTIKYIISRGKFLFVFFINTPVYHVLEFVDNLNSSNTSHIEPVIRLASIEKLAQDVLENTSVIIDYHNNKFLLVQGEHPKSAFMNKFEEAKKNVFIQKKDRIQKSNINDLFAYPGKVKENESLRHKFEKVRIKYFTYKLENIEHDKNNIPSIIFKNEIFPNTAIGQEVKNLAVSENPRFILAAYSKKHLSIFQQGNIDELNSVKKAVNHNINKLESANNSITHRFFKQSSTFNIVNTKTFDHNHISCTISPLASNFFVTFEDTSYLYAILDKEVKELAKINSYCQEAAFSLSGKFLAFTNTDFGTEYNLIILNINTFDVEYIIAKLPLPSKIMWVDNDDKIIILFQDTSINILGWSLREKRFIEYNSKEGGKDKNNDEVQTEQISLFMRITDYTEKIIDFAYDHILDYLVICSDEKIVKIWVTQKEDISWEFPLNCKYTSVLLIKKLDIIIFGTSEGSIRICLWPITNYGVKGVIDHPEYTEKYIHSDKVTQLYISKDLKFLYSSSADGSIFVSILQTVTNDTLIDIHSFAYFDQRNILPKKLHMTYSDLTFLTEGVYKGKLENIDKKETEIQTINSNFLTDMEKLIGENAKDMDKKRNEMSDEIEKKRKTVKNLEDEKETLSKILREKRETQIRVFREDVKQIKTKYKIEKDQKQMQTKTLSNLIKEAKLNFSTAVTALETKRDSDNQKIKFTLDNLLKMLNEKFKIINKAINVKNSYFDSELINIEDKYENTLRDQESKAKNEQSNHLAEKKNMENEISKIRKDNKNYEDKIKEWERHLSDLKNNNTELMESFLFNTLKLKQMNNMLKENEKKISENEGEVKQKRTVNDRLEQLRYVLEYQIKNLIKEKTPIEQQIKNFEELHNDFYKRFNLLYAEQLNIDEFINNNQQLILSFKDELAGQKGILYNLKNLYRSIELEIHFIFNGKIEDKNEILNKLITIYDKYMRDFIPDDSQQGKHYETQLQSKIIEKEVNKQKNKVLKDLITKRQDRKDIYREKDDLMLSIRLENQQLIEECSSIRSNLEDILKYITDIEKKFIELTNTHVVLHKNINTKMIRENIKLAKKSIMLGDSDKTKIARGNVRGEPLKTNNTEESNKVKTIENIKKAEQPNKALAKLNIVQKLEDNKVEIKLQNEQIEKMHQKIKDLIGVDVPIKPVHNTSRDNNQSKRNFPVIVNQSGFESENMRNSRVLSVRSSFLDINTGILKDPKDLREIPKSKFKNK